MSNRRLYILAAVAAVVCLICVMIPVDKHGGQEILGISEPEEKTPSLQVCPVEEGGEFPLPESTVYQMGLYLDIENRELRGISLINTCNTTKDTLQELWFSLYPNAFKEQKRLLLLRKHIFRDLIRDGSRSAGCRSNGERAEYRPGGDSPCRSSQLPI